MTSDTVIQVENLSKRYILGQNSSKGDGLRHVIEGAVKAPFRWAGRLGRSSVNGAVADSDKEFWALRGINLEVKAGEVVGIIGRNGAGKSTMLKLLSRITEPTEGKIRMRGRVASLLEVGTGFHPELTGRENIFLNGAILGMSRVEIKRRFDEIVEFSEVERFLDTPVKRYSSGMYVRLAFAVAAHLEPEVLIVDEVLAVGDAAFQKKCLSKMDDVGKSGRTILFVSHNMQSILRLCDRCVMLEKGRVMGDGVAHEVASAYMSSGNKSSAVREWEAGEAPGNQVMRLRRVRVVDEASTPRTTFDIRKPVRIELTYDVLQAGRKVHPNFALVNEEGVVLFVAQDTDPEWRGRDRPAGTYVSRCIIPGNTLTEGGFGVNMALTTLEPEEHHAVVQDMVFFRVVDDLDAKDTSRGEFPRPIPGLMRPMFDWSTESFS